MVVPSGEALLFLSRAGTLGDTITIDAGTWGSGAMWLTGSSSDWQQPRPDDHVWIARLGADGTVGRTHRCMAQTAVELAVDRQGQAWVGTYTYDENGERGELYGLSVDGAMQWSWRMEDPPSGIGAPLFLDPDLGIVATSNGVAGFELAGD